MTDVTLVRPRRGGLSDLVTFVGVGSTGLYVAVISLVFFGGFGAGWIPLWVLQIILPGFILGCGIYGFIQMFWVWGRNKTRESLIATDVASSMVAIGLTPVIVTLWMLRILTLGYEGFWMFLGVLMANAFEGLALLMAWSMVATARDEHPGPS